MTRASVRRSVRIRRPADEVWALIGDPSRLKAGQAIKVIKGPFSAVVDLSDILCPGSSCPVVIDRMIVYRDDHHLTATFAASLADVLGERLPPIDAAGTSTSSP